jgi:hypothetical protein
MYLIRRELPLSDDDNNHPLAELERSDSIFSHQVSGLRLTHAECYQLYLLSFAQPSSKLQRSVPVFRMLDPRCFAVFDESSCYTAFQHESPYCMNGTGSSELLHAIVDNEPLSSVYSIRHFLEERSDEVEIPMSEAVTRRTFLKPISMNFQILISGTFARVWSTRPMHESQADLLLASRIPERAREGSIILIRTHHSYKVWMNSIKISLCQSLWQSLLTPLIL